VDGARCGDGVCAGGGLGPFSQVDDVQVWWWVWEFVVEVGAVGASVGECDGVQGFGVLGLLEELGVGVGEGDAAAVFCGRVLVDDRSVGVVVDWARDEVELLAWAGGAEVAGGQEFFADEQLFEAVYVCPDDCVVLGLVHEQRLGDSAGVGGVDEAVGVVGFAARESDDACGGEEDRECCEDDDAVA